jgi:2-keto-4-pentenoate hydratase/2-oxohepta-3-ene-1,7-dioic acid hydratase in catechol pathway
LRLVSYDAGEGARFGAQVGDAIIDMARASRFYGERNPSIRPLPERIEDYLADAWPLDESARGTIWAFQAEEAKPSDHWLKADRVTLLPPVPRPPKLICVARNYADVVREGGHEPPSKPILFPRFAATLVAHGADVIVPSVSEKLDYEAELAIVIGRASQGRFTSSQAMDFVYGYTIFNDISVRDFEIGTDQYTAGKNFRASGPLGPCVVTVDEISDPQDLDITTRLNGKVMQSANTSGMLFGVGEILAQIGGFIDLEGGDVITTGTPGGAGHRQHPPVYLRDGDVIEIEISGIGILRNPVRSEVRPEV